MKRSKKIVTPKDVFAHFGVDYDPARSLEDNNRSLSHRIYKDTDCGAWAKVVEMPVMSRPKTVTWKVVLGTGVGGVHFRRALRSDEPKKPMPIFNHRDLPRQVHDLLGLDDRGLVMTPEDESALHWFASLRPDKSIGFVSISRGSGERTLTLKVPMQSEVGKGWVFLCGSIVEGVDAGVEPDPVPLPTTGKKLDKAVEDVDSAANDIWQDTHGCSRCNGDGEVGGSINPDCRACHGNGTAF